MFREHVGWTRLCRDAGWIRWIKCIFNFMIFSTCEHFIMTQPHHKFRSICMNKNGDVCRNTIKRKSAKPMGKSCKTRKGKNRSGAVFHTTLVRLLPQSRRHGCISRDRPPSPKPQKSIKLPLLASAVTFKSLPYTQGPLSELTQEGSHSLTLSVFDRANSLFF